MRIGRGCPNTADGEVESLGFGCDGFGAEGVMEPIGQVAVGKEVEPEHGGLFS